MRLYNTYFLCKNLLPILEQNRIRENEINKSYFIINWMEYVDALDALKEVPMFTLSCKKIYESIPVYVREDEKPLISISTRNVFNSLNTVIISKMKTIIELYESMNLPNTPQSIDIKIPSCTDLKEYIKYLDNIQLIFSQCPYLLCDTEQIQFANVDVGSNWLSFIIKVTGASAAANYILSNLATLLDKAIILRSHYLTLKEQEETLKRAQKETELVNAQMEIFHILKKEYMKQVMDDLASEISPLKDGDEKGRTEKSLETLINLLDKGVEIHASINTAKEIQVLFPPIGETKQLSDNIIKYLEDKTLPTE